MREPRDTGARRRGLRRRPPRGALFPRRTRNDHLRGHFADSADADRARADRYQRARAVLSSGAANRSMSEQEGVMEDEKAGMAGPACRAAGVIGVLGAGTMGAGIAQLACRSGAQTLLHDPIPEALEKGIESARAGLQKEAARGRLSAEDAQAAAERLAPVADLGSFAPCELVIEAVPERLDLKHELYRALSEIVSEKCVLATNTSSLL